jgi:hypothetical protein
MKFSNETLGLLKNFASINTNIVFKQGDAVSTISNAKNVFAKATIKESIPNEFAIYDLNSMLAMLTLVDGQEIEFGDKCLTVTSPAGKFEYYYSNPEIVTGAPAGEIEHVDVYKFKMTSEDIQMIMKAAAITGAPTISITNKNQAVTLSVSDRKNDTASNFKKALGTSFDNFDVFIAVENLKVIPDAYEVSVAKTANGKAKFLHFKHESRQLQYWIACEPGSVV